MVFIDKCSLFGGYSGVFFLVFFIKEVLLKYVLYLQNGLYSEVAFNTGWTVFLYLSSHSNGHLLY